MKSAAKISLIAISYALFAGAVVLADSLAYPIELSITGQIGVNIQWAIPEGRVGASSTNWDTTFALTVHNPGSAAILEGMPDLATTSVDGTHLDPIYFNTFIPGNYDVAIKTTQHLTRKLKNVFLGAGLNTLNFTQANNDTSTIGDVRLLAGDINNAGNSTTTLGDDVVNAVDLNILIDDLDLDDPTAHAYRANFNQDTVVNSVDLSLMIDNLDKTGD